MFGQSAPIDPTVGFTDQIKALHARVAELERAAANNGVSADITGVTAGTGWGSVTLDYCRRVGPTLLFRVTATRTGGNLAAGNIANTTVCTLTGSGATGSFSSSQPISSAHEGPVIAGIYVASTGVVQITATATGVNTSDVISLGGCVLLDT